MTTTTAALNMEIVQGFAFKVFGDLTAQQMGALTTVGDRLGLFTTLAESGPVTSSQFAVHAGVHERYAREWLAAMACQNTLLIVLPTVVTAATATSAMSAASKPYSSRSCPS